MTWRRVVVASVIAGVITTLAHAQTGPSPLGASDLVEIATQRNREFLAAREHVNETQGLLRRAGVRPAPALEIEGSAGGPLGSEGEDEFSVGYFHTIETFGKRGKRITVAQLSAEAAEADLADQLRLLAFEVKVRHAAAVRERQKLETVERLLSTNREYYRLTEMRVQQGDAAPLEGQLFLADLSRVQAQQAVLASGADRALLELRKVVGIPPSEPLPLVASAPPAFAGSSLSVLQEQALRDRPDLRVLHLLEEQALAEEDLVRAEGKPDLTASARYTRTNSGFDQFGFDDAGQLVPLRARDNMLTVGLSVLLFHPRRNQGAMEAAQARSASAQLHREHLQQTIRLEVEAAFRRWEAAQTTVEILDRGVVGQSQRNLEVVRQAHNLGELRILDVLNEQRRLIETQLVYLDAQAELVLALAELERAVGGSIQ